MSSPFRDIAVAAIAYKKPELAAGVIKAENKVTLIILGMITVIIAAVAVIAVLGNKSKKTEGD